MTSSKPRPLADASDTQSRRRFSRIALVGLGLGVAAMLLVGGGFVFADWLICLPADSPVKYVGRKSCLECHQQQANAFHGSHHDLAMDRATDKTVLGNFDGATLTHFDVTSRMYRDGDKYMIHTEGPDGKMADFEVKYVFGVEPLQQYMVEFDRPQDMPADEIARLQVLRVSWDTKRERWFYLPPPDVDEKLAPNDDLHWTGIAQRWNTMCADCHSTNLQKRFDVETKTYHTTFSEIDVSCEACHGPGSLHVKLANERRFFWDRNHGYGLPKLKSDNADIEIQTCARCHARRRVVHPNFRPGEDYFDYMATELLHQPTYHADGQILDEVYVHGSFLQSKMYHKGIRCTDCHDPHTARLKHKGNKVCTSCHQHPAGKYDGPAHHRHKTGSTGASCVECHMPETTYMEVDPRRDHSLRVPRPDLSVTLGTPNACTRCHLQPEKIASEKRDQLKEYADWLRAAREGDEEVKQELSRLDKWAAETVVQWYGEKTSSQPHFAQVLAAARDDDPQARKPLEKLAADSKIPAIVRATALAELNRFADAGSREIYVAASKDKSPLVRAAAVAHFEAYFPTIHAELPRDALGQLLGDLRPIVERLLPALEDKSRLVRTEAARVLAHLPAQALPHLLSSSERDALRAALEDFVTGQLVSNDRAGAHLTLGILYEAMGNDDKAIKAYKTAIHVEPLVTGPRTNLAAVHDRLAQQADQFARMASRQGDRTSMERFAAEMVQHQQAAIPLRREELDLLARDAKLLPENAAIQYRYGLSLYLHDRYAEAETALRKAVEIEPRTADYRMSLALLYEKQQRWADAISQAQHLSEIQPDNPQHQELLQRLRQQRPRVGPPAP